MVETGCLGAPVDHPGRDAWCFHRNPATVQPPGAPLTSPALSSPAPVSPQGHQLLGKSQCLLWIPALPFPTPSHPPGARAPFLLQCLPLREGAWQVLSIACLPLRSTEGEMALMDDSPPCDRSTAYYSNNPAG